jgi:hypothetical protein
MLLALTLFIGLLKHMKLNLRALLAVPPRSRFMPLLQILPPLLTRSLLYDDLPPTRASVGDAAARTRSPWHVETPDTQFYGPLRRSNTTADGAWAPRNTASIDVASTSKLKASTPAVASNDFAESAADSLHASLDLAEEGSAMHNSIKATLAFHSALMANHHHKIEISGNAAREDARVTNALLKRLKTSTLSDDADDGNNTPEEAAGNDLIRRRNTRRLI